LRLSILRLPPEISSQIFLASITHDATVDISCTSPHSPHSLNPIVLGRICAAWRHLAWSLPLLWNRVAVSLTQCSPTVCILLEQWVARSGQLPLSIYLTCNQVYLDIRPDSDVMRTFTIISRCCERWYHIDFQIPAECFQILACVQGRLSFLTSMVLNTDLVNAEKSLQMFSVSPRLQAVVFKGIPMNVDSLPRYQLTTICGSVYALEHCLDVFRRSPQLVKCRLTEISHFQGDVLHPVVAPHLESLHLSFKPGCLLTRPISDIIDALTLPSIREFALEANSETFPHMSFIKLLDRSSCSLTRLDLWFILISDIHLLEFLQVLPSLTHLDLGHSGTTGVFRMLNPHYASHFGYTNPLLPKLHTFVYEDRRFNLQDVTDMLAARWNLPTTTAPVGKYFRSSSER
jgi:F-box-like